MWADPADDVAVQHEALRQRVTVRTDDVVWLRVGGADAFAALDWLCPAELFLREGQVLQTLLLRADGTPLSDLYLARDEEDYVLLSVGPTADELVAHVRANLLAGPGGAALDVTVTDLGVGATAVALDGPYAWELLAAVTTPEVIGLPYASLFRHERWLCVRGGKTGEYGYSLLVPDDEVAVLEARLAGAGPEFGLSALGAAALDQAQLEGWFFNIRREGQLGLGPLELQQQWRLSAHKDHLGGAALRAQRAQGARRRTTCVVSAAPLLAGDAVCYRGRPIGALLNAGYSHTRGDHVGMALLDLPFAYPGVTCYEVVPAGGGPAAALRTVSPPVLNNRSLHVNPQRHRYALRGDDEDFPPIVLAAEVAGRGRP